MVDFNNETTIGTPAVDVVRILILQRHSDLLEAYEQYNKQLYNGVQPSLAVVRARVLSLYIQIHASLKRRLSSKDYDELKRQVHSKELEDIKGTIFSLNDILDDLRLTRIDTKKQYDSTSVEAENKARGL